MARKRKRRKKATVGAAADAPALRERARAALSRGKTPSALQAAKAFAKVSPGAEAEALLLEAYRARIEHLARACSATDALQLVEYTIGRFPDAGEDIAGLGRRIAASTGRLDGLLGELADPTLSPRRRKEALDLLRECVRDPAEVTAAGVLPADHPLNREAACAGRIFALATREPREPREPGGGADGGVPRRSPFAPFVLLAHAVRAAYRRDRNGLEEVLSRLPAPCPAARLAPALRALTERRIPKDLSPAQRHLVSRILGDGASLGGDLRRLAEHFEEGRFHDARALSRDLLGRIAKSARPLLPEFRRLLASEWATANFPPDAYVDLVDPRARAPAEGMRCTALAAEEAGFLRDAIETWDLYLVVRGPDAGPVEAGLVRARQASVAQLLLLSSAMDEVLEQNRFEEDWAPESPQEFLSRLRSRIVDPLRYSAAAAEADPCPSNFRQLHDHGRILDPEEARSAAARWHEAHPEDIDALLALARVEAELGSEDGALAHLEEAARLSPAHPEVREFRFELLLEGVAERLRRGDGEAARSRIARLSEVARDRPEPARRLGEVLLWFASEEMERDEILGRLQAAAGGPAASLLLDAAAESIGAYRLALRLPPVPPPRDPAVVSRALAEVRRVLGAGGLRVSLYGGYATALNRALKEGHVPAAADLEPLADLMLAWGRKQALFHLSRIGLSRPGPRRHRFLMYRAHGLGSARGRRKRRTACLRAARELAHRVGDERTAREAEHELETVLGRIAAPLAPGEAEAVLAREAKAGPGDAPGGRGRRRDVCQGRLFE